MLLRFCSLLLGQSLERASREKVLVTCSKARRTHSDSVSHARRWTKVGEEEDEENDDDDDDGEGEGDVAD